MPVILDDAFGFIDGLDHWPAFWDARLSASTCRALARAARRRSSDAGSVIRRRRRTPPLGRDPATRPPGSLSRRRLPRGDDDTIWTAWVTRAMIECNSLFSRASAWFSLTSSLTCESSVAGVPLPVAAT